MKIKRFFLYIAKLLYNILNFYEKIKNATVAIICHEYKCPYFHWLIYCFQCLCAIIVWGIAWLIFPFQKTIVFLACSFDSLGDGEIGSAILFFIIFCFSTFLLFILCSLIYLNPYILIIPVLIFVGIHIFKRITSYEEIIEPRHRGCSWGYGDDDDDGDSD